MALITCKECNKMISTMAVVCPHCGAPPPVTPASVQPNSNLITKERSIDHQDLNRESAEPANECKKMLTVEEARMEEMVGRARKSGKSLADELWPKSAQTSAADQREQIPKKARYAQIFTSAAAVIVVWICLGCPMDWILLVKAMQFIITHH
jgi:hypothetical protein